MTANRSTKPSSEELIIYSLLVVIGVIPGLIALVQRAVFGVEATLGLLMACAGLVGMIAYRWRTRRHWTG